MLLSQVKQADQELSQALAVAMDIVWSATRDAHLEVDFLVGLLDANRSDRLVEEAANVEPLRLLSFRLASPNLGGVFLILLLHLGEVLLQLTD